MLRRTDEQEVSHYGKPNREKVQDGLKKKDEV